VRRRTRVALLGTLGPLHTEPLRYDLACLQSLVEALEPDLLGVEADPGAWERGDLGQAPIEVQQALVAAARHTNTVLVPLGGPSSLELAAPEGRGLATLRGYLVRTVDRLLISLERSFDGPKGVNGLVFRYACGLLCELEAIVASDVGRRAWENTNGHILERLLWLIRRDPGRRVLAAIQCRRVYWLETHLRPLWHELVLVSYEKL
jgi:hypothetical protein